MRTRKAQKTNKVELNRSFLITDQKLSYSYYRLIHCTQEGSGWAGCLIKSRFYRYLWFISWRMCVGINDMIPINYLEISSMVPLFFFKRIQSVSDNKNQNHQKIKRVFVRYPAPFFFVSRS